MSRLSQRECKDMDIFLICKIFSNISEKIYSGLPSDARFELLEEAHVILKVVAEILHLPF